MRTDIIGSLAQQCNVAVESIEDAYPCTPFQAMRMRASRDFAGLRYSTSVYALDDNIASNIGLLKKCWELVYESSPILRTRIAKIGQGDADRNHVQVVIRDCLRWTTIEDVKTYQNETEHLLKPLQYGEPMLYFAATKNASHFVITIHHALFDNFSLALLWSDIAKAWNHGGELKQTQLSRPPYNRFISYLCKGAPDESNDFWEDQISGYKRPRPSKTDDSSVCDWPIAEFIDAGEVDTGSLGRPDNEAARPPSIVKAAWACTLMEVFQTPDVVWPDYYSGRNCDVGGVGSMSGPTICFAPMRVQAPEDLTLVDLVDSVQSLSDSILAHEQWGWIADPKGEAYDEKNGQYVLNVINADTNSSRFQNELDGMTRVQPERSLCGIWDCIMVVAVDAKHLRWRLFADPNRLPKGHTERIVERFPSIFKQLWSSSNKEKTRVHEMITI